MVARILHLQRANGSRDWREPDWREPVPPNLVPRWYVESPHALVPQPDEATARKLATRIDSDVYRAVRLWGEAE